LSSGRVFKIERFRSRLLRVGRDLIIYLPPGYDEQPQRRFPIFYLQDGQNLFDPATSFIPGKYWHVGETADYFIGTGAIQPLIIVGIYNLGKRRMREYTPTRTLRLGGGKADRYLRMMTEELRPYMESNFRVLPDAWHTGIGGSSLGGLISLYLGFANPQVFSRIAVMSPSLWWDHRSILNAIERQATRPDLRIWLDMGTAEGLKHQRDADMLERLLIKRGWQLGVDLAYTKAQGAVHTEKAWSDRFGDVLRFLFPA